MVLMNARDAGLKYSSTKSAALMIQATGSHVGKTMLVAGLCRHFHRSGLKVKPFKPQNMSNNAAATTDGGEIGRAQALQARACRLSPSIHMNPVLLKPQSDSTSQVVVQGDLQGSLAAREYFNHRSALLDRVMTSFAIISQDADLVLIEGAGSCAEINLRRGDIANMGFAEQADVPVVLAGDISRGGVIAAMVGSHALITQPEKERIKGYIINKFCGDPALFDDGLSIISRLTGWENLGVVPWFDAADLLPSEDSLGLVGGRHGTGAIKVAVPVIGNIANFDDIDPLRLDPGIRLDLVTAGNSLPEDAEWIILLGAKTTIADLKLIKSQGWDRDIARHVNQGGKVFGICGGYQMLGRTICDPKGIEGDAGSYQGLGLLPVDTTMGENKLVGQVSAIHRQSGQAFNAYKIHVGVTTVSDGVLPFCSLDERPDGAVCQKRPVYGTYAHGLFANDNLRQLIFGTASRFNYWGEIDQTLDALADHLSSHLNTEALLRLAHLAKGGLLI